MSTRSTAPLTPSAPDNRATAPLTQSAPDNRATAPFPTTKASPNLSTQSTSGGRGAKPPGGGGIVIMRNSQEYGSASQLPPGTTTVYLQDGDPNLVNAVRYYQSLGYTVGIWTSP